MTKDFVTTQQTVELIQSLFSYDPETGHVYWKAKGSGRIKKKPAGTIEESGYIGILVNGKRIRAHRIAWVIQYGKWPSDQIDHINGNPSDNRLCNLREATNLQNGKNCKLKKSNSSGFAGISFEKFTNKWKAYIKVNYKNISLGRYLSIEDAVLVRKQAEEKYFGKWNRSAA